MFNESNESWVWILVIFALLFGWGGNGFGGGNGANANYVLSSDFASLSRQMDNGFDGLRQQSTSIANGICSLGYDQLAQMNGINTNILTNSNALQSQLASCCCENRQAISNAVQTIVNNDNQNYRALHDEIMNNRLEDFKTQIANQQQEIQNLRLASSQCEQNAYLINQLRPSPIPSYPVVPPYYVGGTTIA